MNEIIKDMNTDVSVKMYIVGLGIIAVVVFSVT